MLVLIIVLVQDVAIFKGYIKYDEYREEAERRKQTPYYTEKKLSYTVMITMQRGYKMQVGPYVDYPDKDDKHWPDYSYYTMVPTEETEKIVQWINCNLFDDLSQINIEAYEKAIYYGLTAENRMTCDWVMENPQEAHEIYIKMAGAEV